jgi:acetylornithine deacetylase/succinyl-diaminopimelate desuccinylase-like protein
MAALPANNKPSIAPGWKLMAILGGQALQDVFQYVESHRDEMLTDLFTLVRQPSISTQGIGVVETAQMLAELMRKIGIETTIYETKGFPIVYGEITNPGATKTLLAYGHYDVQPPEPLELWKSPPFEPTIRDGRIWGRGTADNKGQLLAHLFAAKAFLETRGAPPVNLKFLFEGEEEMNSINLWPFVESHRDLLKADAALTGDGPSHPSGRQLINCGVKGMCYVEIKARGANRDLHSMRGSMVRSAAWKLVHALTSLKDREERILIPGFYDAVRPPTEAELAAVEAIPYDAAAIRADLEVEDLIGGDDAYYRNFVFGNSCNIAGLTSGYQGQGMKTVLPSRASAKIDFRLVPDQRPEDIVEKLKAHLEASGFGDLQVEYLGGFYPSRTPVDHPYVRSVVRATRFATGKEPVLSPNMAGSGPDYVFTGLLGLPSVWMPLSPHDSNNHAPNENIYLEGYFEGIKISAAIMEEMAK